ncbi:HEAT repeat domain-containing protein [Blastopirellula sp. JC732]|uniref:HEAT repeat domain-containing protein n=1 Tax=Blastopirellula sediminis TaxID=2894196 RepID=A0A9X1MN98_9BACT|nr:PVC-type heme-binding CxxCH protein [Blastopirellula sediminis]MCC9607332.1 HEAT repeat domain-containing protein [Blastopirellula sediminis]MCC9629375.1 HEAT repeat domain-containing protein [Blastopirellula sediminis]
MKRIASCLIGLVLTANAFAQRDLKDIPDPDPAKELETFLIADGFEVNLYASDPAIAKPIQMNFDAEGRLWVASSSVYPQIEPGQKADDKIVVLIDKDKDGVAETSQVFADGLLIPTGVLPGDGGVYVANSTELLHMRDTNGDGKADQTRVVLSGFGTEDTHHILHTLRWGHDGNMYFNQSIYIHSHVETPYGVRRLDGGGIWRFRPETMELDVLCKGFVNTWGHHFNRYGANFATDGAYMEGINYVFPDSVFVSSPNARRLVNGLNPGSPKHCGLEILSGGALPQDWQGNCITNDFRAHRVCRFILDEEGSGYSSRQGEELIKTSHVAFRPVDVKMGPDGAIYIADWYNPIIQHGEVDFRDERRDQTHGRIWRVTRKDMTPLQRQEIVGATEPELFELLTAQEEWVRLWAKLTLKARGAEVVLPELEPWVANLDGNDPLYLQKKLEVLWIYQNLNIPNEAILSELLVCDDHNIRAAAVRVLSQWDDRLPNTLEALEVAVTDPHPRVRLEAVCALSKLNSLDAAETALLALDYPMDRFLDFALWSTLNELSPVWLPKAVKGEVALDKSPEKWLYAFAAVESGEVVAPALSILNAPKLSDDARRQALDLAAQRGNPEQLRRLLDIVLDDTANADAARRAELLSTLSSAFEKRKVKPAGDLTSVGELLDANNDAVAIAAANAVGLWQVADLRDELAALATTDSVAIQAAALNALAQLKARGDLIALADKSESMQLREAATAALVGVAPNEAAKRTVALLADAKPAAVAGIVAPYLMRKGGQATLAGALTEAKLPGDVAKMAIRAVRTSPQPEQGLIAALGKSGGVGQGDAKQWTDQELAAITAALPGGDPARGELIFRNTELNCTKCHAIGPAGGLVGPNLISLGASAQPDYVVESLLRPSAKLKENYNSLILLLDDGRVVSGIPVRRTAEELFLRDAEDKEVAVPIEAIEEQRDGQSLMPAGAVDQLTTEEIVDLAAFLAQLGKVGPYSISPAPIVRRWEALDWTKEGHSRLNRTSSDTASTDDAALTWSSRYSKVDGSLPLDELPQIQPHSISPHLSFVRFNLNVAKAGKITIDFGDVTGLKLWDGQSPTPIEKKMTFDWPQGEKRITLEIDRDARKTPLKVEVIEAESTGRAEPIGGK